MASSSQQLVHLWPETYRCLNSVECRPKLKSIVRLTTIEFLAHLIDFYQMCYCYQKLDFLYIWGRSVHLRPDSSNVQLSDWLRDRISLKCTYIWGQFCTFEAQIIYFVMWCLWANQRAVHLRPIPLSQSEISASNVQRIGLKCTESASNVHTFEADPDSTGRGSARLAGRGATVARGSDALAWEGSLRTSTVHRI